jgi:hypothetical protein
MMMVKDLNAKMQFTVAHHPWDFGYILRIGIDHRDQGGGWSVAKFLFEDIGPEDALKDDQCLPMTEKNLQCLMDELWKAGIRPSNGEGNIGQIGAVKDHLADMRKLAFEMHDANMIRLKPHFIFDETTIPSEWKPSKEGE